MATSQLRKISHAVFSIHFHVVFVTKYRRKVLLESMLDDLKEVFSRVLESNGSYLEECNLEPDHVHLLIDVHPDNNIANLIASLKSASSRVLRQKYPEYIARFYWGEGAKLWHDSKCIVSCGGAPLELVKQYIQNQSGGLESKK